MLPAIFMGLKPEKFKNFNNLIKNKNFINSNKNDLKLAKFGTFKRKITVERVGRNPKTGQEYIIKQRKKIRFYI